MFGDVVEYQGQYNRRWKSTAKKYQRGGQSVFNHVRTSTQILHSPPGVYFGSIAGLRRKSEPREYLQILMHTTGTRGTAKPWTVGRPRQVVTPERVIYGAECR